MPFYELLKIVLFGALEGITEWLPISSTAHLLLLNEWLPINARREFLQTFFVVIQLGAVLAVPILFPKQIFPLQKTKGESPHAVWKWDKNVLSLWGKIIVACIPACLVGLFLDDFIEAHLHTPFVISLTLIGYGLAFIFVERKKKNAIFPIQSTKDISYKTAFCIGCFQALALIPGTSRSGATILGALLLGVARPQGAEFTFILALPVMLGASALKLFKFFHTNDALLPTELACLLLGSLVAFMLSLWVISFLMRFIKKRSFTAFGVYRILLGIVVIATMVLPKWLS